MYNIQILSLFIGTILPIVVGLVTKSSWGGGARAVLLALLSVVNGFGISLLDHLNSGVVFDWKGAALTALGAWIVAVGTHFGLWSPTGVADAAKRALVKDSYGLAA